MVWLKQMEPSKLRRYDDENRAIVGDRVRERRVLKRMTQADLADLCGVSKNTIARIERGEQQTNSTNLIRRMGLALGVSGYYLLGLRDDSAPSTFLDDQERELIQHFRLLSESEKQSFLETLKDARHIFARMMRARKTEGQD